MKKDTLTLDRIKSDYKMQFFNSIKIVLILPIVFILLAILIVYLFSCLKNSLLLLEILILSPVIFFFFLCLAVLWDSYKKYRDVKNGLFRVTTDKLVGSQEKRTYIGSAFGASFSRPYILNFASFGSYCIPNGKSHNSSALFEMTDKGVFNYSDTGDVFYLVLNKKEEILLAYNTKLFELQE